MTSTFSMRIGGEDVDTSAITTAADTAKLIRERMTSQASEFRRLADALLPRVELAQARAREAGNTQGTLLPELAEELDKPWNAAEFGRSPIGRYASHRDVSRHERDANSNLRSRQDKRTKHAAGGWGCGFDTVEYAEDRAEHGRLNAEYREHLHRAAALEDRAKGFRIAAHQGDYVAVDRRKLEANLKRAAQPNKTTFSAGSWVRWDDPTTGRARFGVVTSDPAAYDGPMPRTNSRSLRYIVPNDGGDALVMAPRGSASSGSWRCQRPEWGSTADVSPALAQDGLFNASVDMDAAA